MTSDSVQKLNLPGWMTLRDAEKKVLELTGILPWMVRQARPCYRMFCIHAE